MIFDIVFSAGAWNYVAERAHCNALYRTTIKTFEWNISIPKHAKNPMIMTWWFFSFILFSFFFAEELSFSGLFGLSFVICLISIQWHLNLNKILLMSLWLCWSCDDMLFYMHFSKPQKPDLKPISTNHSPFQQWERKREATARVNKLNLWFNSLVFGKKNRSSFDSLS